GDALPDRPQYDRHPQRVHAARPDWRHAALLPQRSAVARRDRRAGTDPGPLFRLTSFPGSPHQTPPCCLNREDAFTMFGGEEEPLRESWCTSGAQRVHDLYNSWEATRRDGCHRKAWNHWKNQGCCTRIVSGLGDREVNEESPALSADREDAGRKLWPAFTLR